MRTSVPPTHRRFPADRRPQADVDLCLRVGRESSPTHRRPPTSRQDSPPVQRRKGKEPAEDPPSGQGPSGPDPPAYNAPRFAPSAPGPSGQRVFSRERAETAPSAGNPPADAPSAVGPSGPGPSSHQVLSRDLTEERIVCPRDEIRVRDAQLHPAQTHSARSPSAADVGGEEDTVDERQADDGDVARPHSPTALDILAGSSEAAGVPSAAAPVDNSQPHSGQSPTQSMATEILPSDDDEGGSTEAMSGSGDTEEEEEEMLELKDLREKHACLWGQYNLVRKSHTHYDALKQARLEELTRDVVKTTEELISEKTQNQVLSEELVRQTRLLAECQLARQADEDLIRRLC
ncbi:hypothetical protein AXG93_136s1020 [Marchantia polymorpha subsp. ruderalis]|uniref:Uncharacterized protein n=1 Tax=Marchantia polymorpha subsp. ruderalis TaxID=1480154 RepID=A0A176W4Y4_MARPO|nr:hypothetical protein AXG93_136s1020 [Marchantia polymorpha subsp. ruderalis]